MRGLQEVKGESPKPSSRDPKKKTMKTNKQTKTNRKADQALGSELKNRTEQLSETETAKIPETETAPQETGTVNAPVKPYVNFAERDFNRKLSVEKILKRLERWMPEQFKLAEVVGKWIWITFPEPPIERIRAELSQLGFHWNNTRKCWQHPCGETLPRGTQEPRDKYDVWFPNAHAAFLKKQAEQKAGVANTLEQAAA
jgi:hypothetical protein